MEGHREFTGKDQEPKAIDYSELPPDTADQLQTTAQDKQREFEKIFNETEGAAMELAEQADTDPLTGYYNRRAFLREAQKLIARYHVEGSQRQTDIKPLAFLYLDFDNFKEVNTKYEHAGGDEAIKAVTAALKTIFRPNEDLFGRRGGDELVLALPNLGPQEILKRFGYDPDRGKNAQLPTVNLDIHGENISITLSGGIAEYHPNDLLDDVLQRADRALSYAKTTKNRLVNAGDVPSDWELPKAS